MVPLTTPNCKTWWLIAPSLMKYILIPFIGLTLSVKAWSQTERLPTNSPFVLVDNNVSDLNYLVISPNEIKEVTVLKDSSAIRVFGEKAKGGIIKITTRPTAHILRLPQILDKYNIAPADRNLRVCINKTLVSQPQLILAAENLITGVEITTNRYWVNAEDANSRERFINIQTTLQKK